MAHYYLIGGHGSGDPGACAHGYQEWELARKFNEHLAKYLRLLGQRVSVYNGTGSVMSSKDMFQQTLKKKGLWLFRPDNRVVIETHLNSFNSSACGTETLIGMSLIADEYDKTMNKVLANFFANRGIKKRMDLLNINVAKERGINYRLNELCFISNKNDVKKLVENMDKIALEMAQKLSGESSFVYNNEPKAIGWAYFMGKSELKVKVEIFPWDLYLKKYNNIDKFAHEIKIVTSSNRAIYDAETGQRVGDFLPNSGSRLMYINTLLENKMQKKKKPRII